MGLKAAVQALKKAEPLKDKVQRCKDLLNDNDAWVCQQQLQKIYQRVLILDLEYALDRKVEQELWNLGFKNYIATLQSQAKDKKNPKRGESQALLGWCLEAASGFYLTLLQEICTAFDLDLPFRRKGYVYGCTSPWKAVEKLSAPHKSSCFYACQYCLVHLGDIARYRNENKQAELFYRHAVSLSPSSGQPYNQLALLEASRGNKLGTVFHYARSIAVKHPFPVATANLAKTLSSAINDNSFDINGKTKLNSQEYITVFLKFHGVLHNLGNLSIAPLYMKLLTETLTALVATESFDSWMLVQMLAIDLYALQHTAGSSMDSTDLMKIEQLSTDEKKARDCILDLIAGSLSALLLPVYTIKNSIIDYFALPSIKLCLEWIRLRPTVLEEIAFTSRLQIWPGLCVLLNALQNCVVDFDYERYAKVPLPEDRDLQGFLPLEKSFENLKFTNTDLDGDTAMLNKLRAIRILHLGHYLAQLQINGATLVSFTGDRNKQDGKFISASESAGPSNELMKELEELSLNKQKRFITSSNLVSSAELCNFKNLEAAAADSTTTERRVGILKFQNSMERGRDSLSNNTENTIVESNSLPSTRKPRQNVAMQAIIRRAETEQKQVTFKNVSPVVVEENDRKLKLSEQQVKNSIVGSTATTIPMSATELSKSNVITSGHATVEAQKILGQNSKGQNTSPNQTIQNQPSTKLQTAQIQVNQGTQSGPIQMNQATTIQMNQGTPIQINQSTPIQINQGTLIQMNQTVQPNQTPQLNQVTQMNQVTSPKDQQSMLPQFAQQSHALNAIRYENNQTFNVPSPPYVKNFASANLPNQVSNLPTHLCMQNQINGQINNIPPSLPQNIVNQNRKMQPRAAQNIPTPQNLQPNLGMLQQSLGVSPCLQQTLQQSMSNISPTSTAIHLQQVAAHQQNLNVQRQNMLQNAANQITSSTQLNLINNQTNLIGNQSNLISSPSNLMNSQSNLLNNQSNLLNNQTNQFATVASNVPSLASTLATYQTSSQPSMISQSPTSVPHIRLDFGQNVFGQNTFARAPQKRLSPTTMYNGVVQCTSKNSDVEFPFSDQAQVGADTKSRVANDYPVFRNYEALSTNDFGMWKDARHPQTPMACWWGMESSKVTSEEPNRDTSFQKWQSPQNSDNAIGRLPISMTNDYQRNTLHDDKRYGIGNAFEDARSFEVDRKPMQTTNTGNTYSLFSGNTWTTMPQTSNTNATQDQMKARFHQQSLWSGPGPSPLERLLEQQKSLREGGT